jgi:hypothetical protein
VRTAGMEGVGWFGLLDLSAGTGAAVSVLCQVTNGLPSSALLAVLLERGRRTMAVIECGLKARVEIEIVAARIEPLY